VSAPDDVMILLKKFSGSMDIKMRRISIIGYVAFLSQSYALSTATAAVGSGRSSW
jgi:hypothetical protein